MAGLTTFSGTFTAAVNLFGIVNFETYRRQEEDGEDPGRQDEAVQPALLDHSSTLARN